ncbi:RidA family protein [Aliikangiella coralliicola]|uniref:RidA family protein n=1 Tax=Aliikangiella coralliicola TaxID=2592383 RepID=A0A545UC22_9GAMM|nr:RidA family protein [Aliikangiella coralliicola]TQV87018.1 RidA family protein [Aliikangiella coralliicola]
MTISIRHDPYPVMPPYEDIYAFGVETRAQARILNISGQVGVSPEGELPSDFAGQCRQALHNVEAILKKADMKLSDIVKTTFYLTRREDMPALIEVRKEILGGVRPANTTLFISGLVSPDWFVEVDIIACAK